jgi:hypothetical protein
MLQLQVEKTIQSVFDVSMQRFALQQRVCPVPIYQDYRELQTFFLMVS